ncbi:hypothetical protein EDB89DRAFT_493263 [Lactarius sanguifluus]|nr:hypothetical protein EDB89DRAFT_493263 [Lactarius sanguifluus]
MNVVREINRINEQELGFGAGGASWHDEYKDSAYIFIGGLHYDLTEGDVITIFSQYGEVVDVDLPRNKETGKTRGFGFLMTLRVDHVKKYRQPRTKGEDGEWKEAEGQSLNAIPKMIEEAGSESSGTSEPDIDPDDPMRDYLLQKWREERAGKKA